MCEEPLFLDDETLTDNLTEDKASRVINWLISVFQNSLQDIDMAILIAKKINLLFKEPQEEFELES